METNNSEPQKLSQRETEVLQLIIAGQNNPQIAGELNISTFTVRKHRENLMNKLQVHNLAQLIKNVGSKGL